MRHRHDTRKRVNLEIVGKRMREAERKMETERNGSMLKHSSTVHCFSSICGWNQATRKDFLYVKPKKWVS